MDPQWAQVVIQLGALGILGYHLLFGLPQMLKDVNSTWTQVIKDINLDHTAERAADRVEAIAARLALERQTAALPNFCKMKGELGKP